MPDCVPAALEVAADLRLVVTAPSGESTTARISGDGTTVHVVARRPEVLFSAVSPADVGRAADLLAASGLVAVVSGPRGLVATVGTGVHDRVGRAVTGSVRIALAPRAVLRVVAGTRAARVTAAVLALAVLGRATRRCGGRRR